MQKLTGTWGGDGNGMTYHFTPIEKNPYMNGNSCSYCHVGFGTIHEKEESVILQWVNTPSSAGCGYHGIC